MHELRQAKNSSDEKVIELSNKLYDLEKRTNFEEISNTFDQISNISHKGSRLALK